MAIRGQSAILSAESFDRAIRSYLSGTWLQTADSGKERFHNDRTIVSVETLRDYT